MRRFGLNTKKISGALAGALLVVLAMALPTRSMAQGTASIHGHITNAAGIAVNKGEVRLTTDRSSEPKDRKYTYKFPVDANGDYKGTGIAPGNYVVIFFQDEKSVDFNESVVLANGDDKLVNFDMTRPEYIAKMSPEDKKALEEYKKKNAEIVAGNAKIQNLNGLLLQARADNKAGDYDKAMTEMQQATTMKPDEAILWIAMGDAQLGSADAAAKAAKAAGTPPTDPAIAQKYTDAATSYKKAVDLNAASKKPVADVTGVANSQLGLIYAKQGNAKDAAEAYDIAAKALPASAGSYYYNEAVTLYKAQKMPEAAAAADKAIAADPKKADAYYIKVEALAPGITTVGGKYVTPPGLAEAANTYLDLAPTGPYAGEMKGLLTELGEKIQSGYKAPKK
ncbi:MAG: tetratricopeptide repeat protein [Edaphobacter sp.]